MTAANFTEITSMDSGNVPPPPERDAVRVGAYRPG
jgi:hypothetical protein